MFERLWRLAVFTDENGGKFYYLNIEAENADAAERKAVTEVQLAFALMRPLVRVLWAHAQPKESSGHPGHEESS